MKIDRIELCTVRYPLCGYFKFFGPAAVHTAVTVKLTADDGTTGWGQSLPVTTWSCETPETAAIVLRDYFGPAVIGRDPVDLESCQESLDRALAPSFSTAMPITRAGLDIALHDLAGRLQGKSLAAMWGVAAPSRPVTLSWTVNARSLDEADSLVAEGRAAGYHNFNLKIAPEVEFDVRLARRVRELAPDGFLWADANGGYDPETALAAAPRLADAGVDVLEAPLRPNRIAGYQALKRQGALPITMDEGVVSPVDLGEFIRLGMIDGITVKVSRCGGLWPARRQVEIAQREGLFWLMSGLSDPDVALAASLAVCSAFGLAKPAALNGPQFLGDTILARPLAIQGDRAQVPTGPGLGIEVDEEKLRRLAGPPSRDAAKE